jgi:glucose/arabinose dehydrogenase
MFRYLLISVLILAAILGAGAWWTLRRGTNQTHWMNSLENRLASAAGNFGPLKDRIKRWYATPLDLKALQLPPGFAIALFAKTGSPRMMAFSPGGVLLATSESGGTVTALPDADHGGQATASVTVLKDLNGPHGIAFHNGQLYVAEVTRLVRYSWDEARLQASNPVVIAGLPESLGGHMTRTILFANQKLYVSAGSSCNVCRENDPRRAAVLEMNEDGSGVRVFATGLRNAVGLAFNERSSTVWVTDNGRDWLGDELPPDEIDDLGPQGGDFGWPFCYGNRVPDTSFGGTAERCRVTVPPRVELQAHSAPLGLVFYSGQMFPAEYQGDLFVAFHGSWNRSVPTGYKVVRVKMNASGEPERVEDFITGWLLPGETRRGKWMGRPVGLAIAPDGSLYVSDDGSGSIYRVTWKGSGLSLDRRPSLRAFAEPH